MSQQEAKFLKREERDAIRGRCLTMADTPFAGWDKYFEKYPTHQPVYPISEVERFIVQSMKDITVLLDALEAEETERKKLATFYYDNVGVSDNLVEMRYARERWKARAEALERAIGKKCHTCIRYRIGYRGTGEECGGYNKYTDGCNNWQFDQARFSKEGDKCGNG